MLNIGFKELMSDIKTWRDLFVSAFKHPGFSIGTVDWKKVYIKKIKEKYQKLLFA